MLMAPYLKKKYYNYKVDQPHPIEFSEAKNILDDMVIYDNKNITVLNKMAGLLGDNFKAFWKSLKAGSYLFSCRYTLPLLLYDLKNYGLSSIALE